MNTGQMMITLGALALLSIVILRVNNGFLNTSSIMLDSKLGVLATSIGTSMIEEATGKAFDEATVDNSVSSLTSLSSPTDLKKDSGEDYPNFDDFDDFNGLKVINTSIPAAEYHVNCKVEYVDDTNLDGKSSVRTWTKKITVYVSSPSMYNSEEVPDTVVMSALYSYWYFR